VWRGLISCVPSFDDSQVRNGRGQDKGLLEKKCVQVETSPVGEGFLFKSGRVTQGRYMRIPGRVVVHGGGRARGDEEIHQGALRKSDQGRK